MRGVWRAFLLGGAFVAIVASLGHHDVATPVPFFLLCPGLTLGAFVPDSGFDPEGDIHPWGPISTFVVYAVDVAIYSGLAYLVPYLLRRRLGRLSSRPGDCKT